MTYQCVTALKYSVLPWPWTSCMCCVFTHTSHNYVSIPPPTLHCSSPLLTNVSWCWNPYSCFHHFTPGSLQLSSLWCPYLITPETSTHPNLSSLTTHTHWKLFICHVSSTITESVSWTPTDLWHTPEGTYSPVWEPLTYKNTIMIVQSDIF